MSYEYSENIVVRDGAGDLLKNELHWDVEYAHTTEVLGPDEPLEENRIKKFFS